MRKAWKLLQGEGEESIQERMRREPGHKFLNFSVPQSEEAQSCTPERRMKAKHSLVPQNEEKQRQ